MAAALTGFERALSQPTAVEAATAPVIDAVSSSQNERAADPRTFSQLLSGRETKASSVAGAEGLVASSGRNAVSQAPGSGLLVTVGQGTASTGTISRRTIGAGR